jgi:hypothetical protein
MTYDTNIIDCAVFGERKMKKKCLFVAFFPYEINQLMLTTKTEDLSI